MKKFFILLLISINTFCLNFVYGQSKTGRENLYIYEEDEIHSTSQCLICYFKNNKMYWVNNGISTIEWGYAKIDRFFSILDSRDEINIYRLDNSLSNSDKVAYSAYTRAGYKDTFYFTRDFKHVNWKSVRKYTLVNLEDDRNKDDIIYE